MRILALGDIIGSSGRTVFQKHIQNLKETYNVDFVVVNGENSSHGRGITTKIARFFKQHGVDAITSGNHIWANKEVFKFMDEEQYVLRPANYPGGCPGSGYALVEKDGVRIAVVNVQGRVFMRDTIDCPFRTLESLLVFLKTKTNIIFVDFHAEATSEKLGLAYYLDGQISALVGTHTHVQTADERILEGGTAYITDLGMAGSFDSMIGMKKGPIIDRFITQMPRKFEVSESSPFILTGACIEVDVESGKATSIERVFVKDEG
ncbi:TIGR00282 family metallophosphoesterase [bacterium]|nr:TIGR00282 family metallophosphoesterase [bacterium]